jgi:hypothetical protein
LSRSEIVAGKVKIRESRVQRDIMDWLTEAGYLHWRVQLSGVIRRADGNTWMERNPMSGFPDLAGVLKSREGVLFAIECKAVGGKLSAEQERWREELVGAGVVHVVARSVEDVVVALKKAEQ